MPDVRFKTGYSLSGFLQSEELLNLRPCNCRVSDGVLKIHIEKSKTDQLRQGDEILIAKSGLVTCPVSMLELYIVRTGVSWDDQQFLFRPIQQTKDKEVLRASGRISSSCLRNLFNKKLGYPPKEFGLHSLRAGGVTAAANAGIPDKLFKCHGRWRSDAANDGYVKDSDESKLRVSDSLGL